MVAARKGHAVLVVDDDDDSRETMALLLRSEGYEVDVEGTAEAALEAFQQKTYHALVADLMLPGKSGVDLTKIIHANCPETAIILVTGHATLKTAVSALKKGASDYIKKPIVPAKLIERVAALLEGRSRYFPNRLLRVLSGTEVTFEGMIAASRPMHNLFERIQLAAWSGATLLITGESGAGKELVARAVHNRSSRADGPYVPVHTGALPRELIASELFGHEKGSFTDAIDRKEGKFEQAEGGTIFLDEISTMDELTQINLLRVLETFTFARIGGKGEQKVDVRVVAATNKDLGKMVKDGLFREDLYFRLNILNLAIPPLRDRTEDIAVLARAFAKQAAERYHKPAIRLPESTIRFLEAYNWPGNVRELRNVIEQAVLLAPGDSLDPDLLPHVIHRLAPVQQAINIRVGTTLKDAEREIILRTLDSHDGNKKLTAEVLGISRRSLYNKLTEYGVASASSFPRVVDADDEDADADTSAGAEAADEDRSTAAAGD